MVIQRFSSLLDSVCACDFGGVFFFLLAAEEAGGKSVKMLQNSAEQERWKQTGSSSIKESCLLVSSRTNATLSQGLAVVKREQGRETRVAAEVACRSKIKRSDEIWPGGVPGNLGTDCL